MGEPEGIDSENRVLRMACVLPRPGECLVTRLRPEIQRIFRAMKRYGLIVADNGSDMYISGTYDTRWNNDILNPAFRSCTASDFEVITLGCRASAPAPPTNLRTLPEL